MIGYGDPGAIELWGGPKGSNPDESNPVYQLAMGITPKGSSTARVVPGREQGSKDDWWERSDHKVFAALGIPFVLYVGDKGPYHGEKDTFENLDVHTIDAVASHSFRTLAALADGAPAGRGVRLPSSSPAIPDYQVIDAPGPTPVVPVFSGRSVAP
jgi:Peptidase family M28